MKQKPSILDAFSLTGRTALVTGASRGLGRAMAEGLAEAGANLIVVSTREENLVGVVDAVTGSGGVAIPLACDVSDPGQVAETVASAAKQWDRLDILVNCAGTIRRHPAEEGTAGPQPRQH